MSEKSPDEGGRDHELREQDKWLPIANVSRIMKNALPENAKVSKDAKECVQECVSEFVSFITSEASEKCCAEKRKTVNGEDILFAMTSLGFENYAEVLKIYLAKYREFQASKPDKGDSRKRSSMKGTDSNSEADDGEEADVSVIKNEHQVYTEYENEFHDDNEDQAIYEDYSGQYTNVGF